MGTGSFTQLENRQLLSSRVLAQLVVEASVQAVCVDCHLRVDAGWLLASMALFTFLLVGNTVGVLSIHLLQSTNIFFLHFLLISIGSCPNKSTMKGVPFPVKKQKAWASKCTASSSAPYAFFFSCLSSFMYLWWMMWYRILTKLWMWDVQASPRLQNKLYVFVSTLALKFILAGEHFNAFIRWSWNSMGLTLLMIKRL